MQWELKEDELEHEVGVAVEIVRFCCDNGRLEEDVHAGTVFI